MAALIARLPRLGTANGPGRRTIAGFALFALVTISLTVYMGIRISGFSFASTYPVTATFDDVAGLKSGDLVKIDGTRVGQVDGIKVDMGKAVVKMSVRDGIGLPVDSTAAVRWKDLIGTREVYLQPGDSAQILRHGGHIAHTESSVDLGTVINSLGPLTGSLNPTEINQILQAFTTALAGNDGNINQIIQNLSLLLDTFGSRTDTINQMISDYKTVTDAVASRDAEIATTVSNLETLVRAFGSSGTLLTNALTQLHGFTGNLKATVGDQAAQLGRLVGSTKDIMNVAKQQQDTLHKIVTGLPSALQALLTTLDGGHYSRSAMVCININRYTLTCPYPDSLPPAAATGNTTSMSAAQQANFARIASLFLLGATTGATSGGGR